MSNTALFFPGQASQYVGMGRDLYESSSDVRMLYELASDDMGMDLARLSFQGPADELKRTRITQPAILLHSLAVLTVLKENRPEFDYAAGHSLGEYGALAVTGVLSYAEAIKAVVRRASLMEEACISNPGTMAAIIGLTDEQVEEVCQKASSAGVVVAANYNSNNQVVISGSTEGVAAAMQLARDAGAKRALALEVGGAFHSPLMQSAREGLGSYLADRIISAPTKPYVANVTAQPAFDPSEIRRLLVEQITSPVRWSQTMAYLKSQGVTHIIEIGPGKVLTGMAKREMTPEYVLNLDTMTDIRSLVSVGAS